MTLSKQNNLFLYSIIIAFFAYMIPWIIAPTAPLTLGAYDLAEWTSLHPSMPGTTPVLIVSLLLRLQLPIICGFLALFANEHQHKWIIRLILLIVAIAQLPPLEFFLSERDNINYQQQCILALVSLIGSYWIINQSKENRRFIIVISLSVLGIFTSIWGLSYAMTLLAMSSQSAQIGFGSILLIAWYFIMLIPHFAQARTMILQGRTFQANNQTR